MFCSSEGELRKRESFREPLSSKGKVGRVDRVRRNGEEEPYLDFFKNK